VDANTGGAAVELAAPVGATTVAGGWRQVPPAIDLPRPRLGGILR
jgi:hypothetical protein